MSPDDQSMLADLRLRGDPVSLRAAERFETYHRMDRDAAEHVEVLTVSRTAFTGDEPYVGWKGVGLALSEALDERDRLRSLAYVPGAWRCPKCEFTLLQSNLDAQNGTVIPRDGPGDKCPNCKGPLWRTTWRDEATEMLKRAEEQVLRAGEAERKGAADAQRLDFLDTCNSRLNAFFGTKYRWRLILNHNVNRLMLGEMAVDLTDDDGSKAGLASCREAIDAKMREIGAQTEDPGYST